MYILKHELYPTMWSLFKTLTAEMDENSTQAMLVGDTICKRAEEWLSGALSTQIEDDYYAMLI